MNDIIKSVWVCVSLYVFLPYARIQIQPNHNLFAVISVSDATQRLLWIWKIEDWG